MQYGKRGLRRHTSEESEVEDDAVLTDGGLAQLGEVRPREHGDDGRGVRGAGQSYIIQPNTSRRSFIGDCHGRSRHAPDAPRSRRRSARTPVSTTAARRCSDPARPNSAPRWGIATYPLFRRCGASAPRGATSSPLPHGRYPAPALRARNPECLVRHPACTVDSRESEACKGVRAIAGAGPSATAAAPQELT